MNGKERVQMALAHQELDRSPWRVERACAPRSSSLEDLIAVGLDALNPVQPATPLQDISAFYRAARKRAAYPLQL